jgi:hypothetical protein
MAHRPGFELRFMFLASVASMLVQALVSYFWLKREFRVRLARKPVTEPPRAFA